MNSEYGSDQRTSGIESYVWFRRLWRSVSERRMPRETKKHRQKIFQPKQCWFQMQGWQWKGMKGGHKEGTQKQNKVRKVHFAALMDIGHFQKYEYIPENVRKSNLKYGNYENFKLGLSLTKWLTVGIFWKFARMNSISSSSTGRYHHWLFRNVLYEFWQIVNYELVLHCAIRKNTSIICVANLHSLPWNTTSKAHKIRTTFKRRWIFKRALGNRYLHDVCKTRPRKAAAAEAAAAVIPCQDIRGQSPTIEKKDPSRGQSLDYDSWMAHVEKTLFEILIFKYVYFGSTPWYMSQWRSGTKSQN